MELVLPYLAQPSKPNLALRRGNLASLLEQRKTGLHINQASKARKPNSLYFLHKTLGKTCLGNQTCHKSLFGMAPLEKPQIDACPPGLKMALVPLLFT